MTVAVRVVLDDFQRPQAGHAANPLQRSPDIVSDQAVRLRAADTGRQARVDGIEIERHAKTGGGGADNGQCLVQTGGKTARGQFVGSEYPDPQPLQEGQFFRLVAARSENGGVAGIDLLASQAEVEQALVPAAQQAGQRHAMDCPGIGGFRGVAIEMRINPQQTRRLPEAARHAAPRTDGNRVIAADDHRKCPVAQAQCQFVGEVVAKRGNPRRRRHALAGRREQRPPPVEQGMRGNLVPGLRMMKSHRPVLAAAILRTDATGGTDDANAAGMSGGAKVHEAMR